MTAKRTMLLVLLLLIAGLGYAQKSKEEKKTSPPDNSQPTPKNMWEVGAHGGYLFNNGDVATQGGYGAGLHIRKSLDYVFSLRGEAIYGNFSGTAFDSLRNFENNWLSASVVGLFNLNSLRFNDKTRKFTIYAGAGAGASYFEVNTKRRLDPQDRMFEERTFERAITPHVVVTAGFAVRLGKRFNIGIDHQAMLPLGARADLVDGFDRDEQGERTGSGDIVQYANLRLNFNIGSSSRLSEPLYWINPLENVIAQVTATSSRMDAALKDSDGDGVPDIFDEEPDTPPNVPVDTKGRTLDSDGDGIPDYKDREPYNPPRAGEMVNEFGVVTNPNPAERPSMGGGGGVSEERVREIVDEMLKDYRLTESAGSVADWFLPMIHFGNENTTIKYSDYGTLAGIARMMKNNPNMRLVVTGHTDSTGAEELNNMLSFQRAQSVVNHLVENHGIGRGRLLIEWKGPQEVLVPQVSSYMNRRVEFRVAARDDVEMDPPSGSSQKKRDGY